MTGQKRTSELRRLIPGITQKVLTTQLRGLEKNEIVARKVYKEIPPKVQYELTSYGWGLKPALDHLCYWGEDHLEKVHGQIQGFGRVLGLYKVNKGAQKYDVQLYMN